MNRTEIIVSIIIAVIGSAGLNGVITHILYNSKLKKEQKMKAKDAIWSKIVEALEEVRVLEQKARIQEIFDFESIFQSYEYTDFTSGANRYPAIMGDSSDFFDFFREINGIREKWSRYLDPEIGALLFYMQIYCQRLMEYTSKNKLTDSYPMVGCFVFGDFLTWQVYLDNLIVKRLNKSSYKLYSENGVKWEKMKAKAFNKLWKATVLYKLINNIDDPYIATIKKIFENQHK